MKIMPTPNLPCLLNKDMFTAETRGPTLSRAPLWPAGNCRSGPFILQVVIPSLSFSGGQRPEAAEVGW